VNALFVVRPDAATRPGGDIVHAGRTAAALRDLGVRVDVAATESPDASGYDVAHVFGIFEPPLATRQLSTLRKQDVAIALSPILLDLTEYFATAPLVERALNVDDSREVERRLAKLKRRGARRFWRSRPEREAADRLSMQAELLRQADVLLPGGEMEARLCERLRSGVPSVLTPLGADAAAAVSMDGTRAGVLCAGRIESKKNQAALLFALRDVDVDVTLVGDAYDKGYLALCKRWATPRTRFLDHCAHGEALALMSRAAVHALPSWFESPGLSSLEAAAAGAQIVAGNRGTELEYFGSHAEYADPADPASIRNAVLRALERGSRESNDALALRLREFTWRRAAETTLEAYRQALARRRS
jgi:glycosyltransferase involved in cell wall biosynthesis